MVSSKPLPLVGRNDRSSEAIILNDDLVKDKKGHGKQKKTNTFTTLDTKSE